MSTIRRAARLLVLRRYLAAPRVDSDAFHSASHNMLRPALIGRRSMVMVTKTKSDEPLLNESPPHSEAVALPDTLQLSREQTVMITDSCYQRIHHLVNAKQQEDLYLRVFVDAGGCSGFTYKFELDTDNNFDPIEDVVFYEPSQSSPARVVVDKSSLKLIAGSKIDYVHEMIKSSFEVRENPQSESACGCGSSFALKNFSSNPALD